MFDRENLEALCTIFPHIYDTAEGRMYKPFSKVKKRAVALRLQHTAYGTSVVKWGLSEHLIRAIQLNARQS